MPVVTTHVSPRSKLGRARAALRRLVGRRLREVRGERTQRHIAEATALSTVTIGNIEQGRYAPLLGTLLAVANALESDIAALFGAPDVEIRRPLTEDQLRDRLSFNLVTLRNARERYQWEIAEAAALTPEMVSQIETGRRLPSLDALAGIALALGVEPVELIRE